MNRAISAIVAMFLLGGCQSITTAPRAELNETPMVIDDAMQIREWDRSTSYYTNSSFVAGTVGFWYEPRHDLPEYSYPFIETPLFVGQVIGLPVTLVITPPWKPLNYSGLKVDPTHHAMPPLPPSQFEPAAEESPAPPEPSAPVEN